MKSQIKTDPEIIGYAKSNFTNEIKKTQEIF